MSYAVNQKKSFNQSADQVSRSVATTLEGLGGKISGNSNPAKGQAVHL